MLKIAALDVLSESSVSESLDDMTIYLSGANKDCNWRYDLTDTYKSNRALKCKIKSCGAPISKENSIINMSGTRYIRAFKCSECDYMAPDTKPVYYQEIRQYLIARYDAIAVKWGEADDWLGVNSRPNTVIVSNDKDLLMLPAYHYRLTSEKLIQTSDPGQVWLSEDRKKILGGGFKWFCIQMIMGDAIDGIKKPKKGYGPVALYNLFQGINSAAEMWSIVNTHYVSSGKSDDEMLLNAQLLWISRKPKQMFSFELLDNLIRGIDSHEKEKQENIKS